MAKRLFLFLSCLMISGLSQATDLSGFYRCSGSKTLIANTMPKLSAAGIKTAPMAPVKPATPPPAPAAAKGPIKISPVATQPINPTAVNAPTPIVTGPANPPAGGEDGSADSGNDNAIPLNALINLRVMENADNVYGYNQINDDGSSFWGTLYFEGEHLVAGFDASAHQKPIQKGILDLMVKMDDGTFMGHFFIETNLKGSLMCSKLQ